MSRDISKTEEISGITLNYRVGVKVKAAIKKNYSS